MLNPDQFELPGMPKSPGVPVKFLPTYRGPIGQQRDDYIYNGYHHDEDFTTPENRQHFADRIQVGAPAINASSQNIPSIKEGGFLTQHETGTTMGSYSPRMRATYEHKAMGYEEPDKNPDEEDGEYYGDDDNPFSGRRVAHPRYGFIDEPHGGELADVYGDTKFILKPNILHHTTVTDGDSLGYARPETYSRAVSGLMHPGGLTQSHSSEYLKSKSQYIEAQYHKPLTMDDVEHVQKTVKNLRNKNSIRNTLKNLEIQTNKPAIVKQVQEVTQNSLPFDRRDTTKIWGWRSTAKLMEEVHSIHRSKNFHSEYPQYNFRTE